MSNLLPFPLPKKKALEIICELSEVSERIFYSPHAKVRMIERGVTMPDVMDCLGKGQITEGPFQQPGSDWRFTISWFRAGSPLPRFKRRGEFYVPLRRKRPAERMA